MTLCHVGYWPPGFPILVSLSSVSFIFYFSFVMSLTDKYMSMILLPLMGHVYSTANRVIGCSIRLYYGRDYSRGFCIASNMYDARTRAVVVCS